MEARASGEDARLTPELLATWLALHRDLRRTVTAGNAGGLIAALSFLGTLVARSEDPSLGAPIFWVCVLFLVGLAGAVFALATEAKIRGAAARFCEDHDPASIKHGSSSRYRKSLGIRDPLFKRLQRLSVLHVSGTMIAGHCQVIAIVAGLVQLFRLTH